MSNLSFSVSSRLAALNRWIADTWRHSWIVLQEALKGFRKNDDFRQASSLAFASMLACIPALLLLTCVLGMSIGSSKTAMQNVSAFVAEVMPQSGDVMLQEVGALMRHRHTAGLLNLLVLLWAVTPMVSTTRSIFNLIFKVVPTRSFWITKLLDLSVSMIFITGLAAVAGASLILRVVRQAFPAQIMPPGLGVLLPVGVTILLLLLMYGVFAPKMKKHHLLAGAITTTFLWFLLRPAFSLFLVYNPGYGLTFGSFKSLFIGIIWIYYFQAVFLFGAEVMAALHRAETVLIKRLMEGRGGVPTSSRTRFLLQVSAGDVVFREGESGREMYHVLRGAVCLRKGDVELAVIPAGSFFGEMSFLLGQARSATAMALEDCECLVIHEENLDALMREFPAIIRDMLTVMAGRLRDTSARVGGATSP